MVRWLAAAFLDRIVKHVSGRGIASATGIGRRDATVLHAMLPVCVPLATVRAVRAHAVDADVAAGAGAGPSH